MGKKKHKKGDKNHTLETIVLIKLVDIIQNLLD